MQNIHSFMNICSISCIRIPKIKIIKILIFTIDKSKRMCYHKGVNKNHSCFGGDRMQVRKHSKKRDAILECVRSTTAHPTADWVYAQLKPQIPDLSLGTVYRNLAMFKQEGIIASVGVVAGMERFDFNTIPHAHYICHQCDAVIDLHDLALPSQLQVSCGSVEGCSLTLCGVCNECQNSNNTI